MPGHILRNVLKLYQASLAAKGYPKFTRQMSGSSETYALMAFPRHVLMQNYIQVSDPGSLGTAFKGADHYVQCLPEAVMYIGYGK